MRTHKYLPRSAIAAIGIGVGCLLASGSGAQTTEKARCPQGYWLWERLCLSQETGDIVMAEPPPASIVAEVGCAPGWWRVGRVCVSRETGDVELADETTWPGRQHAGADAKR